MPGREFKVYEYVDGDVRVYARLQGEGDEGWKIIGTIKFDHRGHDTRRLATGLGLMGMTDAEIATLDSELSFPRRW